MDGDIRWENQSKTVIRFTFRGGWDWKDFYRLLDQRERCAPGQSVCALVDFRTVTRLPADAILHLRHAAHIAQETSGLIIVIATSVPAATTYRLFVMSYKSMSSQFRLVENDQQAYALLQMPR